MLIDFLSKYIKDRKGIKFYAKSHVDAVYTRDGGKLGDKIEELENTTDPNSHTHSNKTILDSITQSRVQNWDNKVDKVNGMGLSQENYTTEEKERLKNLTNFNDTGLSERISVLEGTVPNLATKEYVSQEVANSNSLKKSIVEVVPTDEEAVDNVIYMVKQTDSEGNVKYQQYLKIDGAVKFIGDTDINLEGYAKTDDVNEALGSKLNKTDIVDNLLSSESDKALSAKQGKELKTVIDANKNDADNHKNDLSVHITSEEKTNINNHMNNSDIHINEEEKDNINSHLNNSEIHMNETDRAKLHEHTNKSLLDSLISNGNGLKYLANDGTYKELFVKSTVQPTDENAIWIDISDIENILLKTYNGNEWVIVGGSADNYTDEEIEELVKNILVKPDVPNFEIVTWADGTYEQIQAMLEAHYRGDINISEYWSVGDTRTVSLTAMEAEYVGESHSAQDVELIIIGFDHDDLTTSINSKTKAAVTVQLKNCLSEAGYMYGSSSAFKYSLWSDSPRRTWCNSTFKNSLPIELSNLIKTVMKHTWRYSENTITDYELYRTQQSTDDYCFLISEFEVYGAQYLDYSIYGKVGDDGIQYDYYKIDANKLKYYGINDNKTPWYTRTSFVEKRNNASFFILVSDNSTGAATSFLSYYTRGIAPAFCI